MKAATLGFLFSILVCGLFFGCATTKPRVLENDDGTFMVKSDGGSEDTASNGAIDTAQEHCATMGKKMVRVRESNKTKSVGHGTRAAANVGGHVAGSVTSKATKGFLGSGTVSSAVGEGAQAFGRTSSEFYFKCK